jgi:imidazoleglycerol phosphate dehydratase HisB
MSEYCAIKWLDNKTAIRKTREVDLKCEIIDSALHIKDGEGITGVEIRLTGTADLEHHLIEDAAILLKKMCDEKCGNHTI